MVSFKDNGNVIENVTSRPHLGHIICNNSDDSKDITDRCHTLIRQINNVLCTFSCLGLIVRVRLLKNYCLSLYGCELWNLENSAIGWLCKAWRAGLRVRVREVPGLRGPVIDSLLCCLPSSGHRSLGFQQANTRSTAIAEGLHNALRHFKCHNCLLYTSPSPRDS